MKFKIVEDDEMVGICCKGKDSMLESFIDIYIDDPLSPSVFESVDDARLFAGIIVKLLEKIT